MIEKDIQKEQALRVGIGVGRKIIYLKVLVATTETPGMSLDNKKLKGAFQQTGFARSQEIESLADDAEPFHQ